MLQDILHLPVHHLVVLLVLHRDGEVVDDLVVDNFPHHRAEMYFWMSFLDYRPFR